MKRMNLVVGAAIATSLLAATAAQAQTVSTISALASATTCPAYVFISDAGKEGLFSPAASGTATQANGGTTIACGTKLYQRIYDGGAINAKWFGVSETAADNSAAVQRAITALRSGQELLIPEGVYRFQNPITLPVNKIVRFTARGELSFGARDGIIVQNRHQVDIFKLHGAAWSDAPVYDNYVGSGITLVNAYHSDVKVHWIDGFRNGIKLTGQGKNGSQYNKVEFDSLVHNDVGVLLATESDGQTNWVNENTFTGGRIAGRTGLATEKGSGQTDAFNGNKFYNFGFEDLENGVDVDFFYKNMFIAPRVEKVAEPFKFGSTASENIILANALYESDFLSNGKVGNAGARTLMLGRLLVPSGSASGVINITDNAGRFLSIMRDPNPGTTSESTSRTLPLSSLPNVSP